MKITYPLATILIFFTLSDCTIKRKYKGEFRTSEEIQAMKEADKQRKKNRKLELEQRETERKEKERKESEIRRIKEAGEKAGVYIGNPIPCGKKLLFEYLQLKPDVTYRANIHSNSAGC